MQREVADVHRSKPVTVLGVDVYNGSRTQLAQFQAVTGVTFPLLQQGTSAGLGIGLEHIVVVDTAGVVRQVFAMNDRARVNTLVDQLLAPSAVPAFSTRLLDFGPPLTVGDRVSREVTIANTGTGTLEVTAIATAVPGLTADRTTLSISPGDSVRVTLTLAAERAGPLSGTVTLSTNAGSFDLSVAAVSVREPPPPMIAVATMSLDFGSVEVGRTGTRLLEIRNDGDGELVVRDLTTELQGVSFSTRSFTVPPGGSVTVTVTLRPGMEQVFDGTVSVVSNDPTRGTFSVPLSGGGVTLANAAADFDGNGKVDFVDFLGFAAAFGSDNPTYDINRNGLVDFADFLIFAQSFGRSVG